MNDIGLFVAFSNKAIGHITTIRDAGKVK